MKRSLAVGNAAVAVLVGCHTGAASSTSPDSSLGAIDVVAFPIRLNPTGPGGVVLYMGGGEGCHGISPSVEVPDLMAAINRSEPASCDGLTDPLWRECRFGAVYAKPDRSECLCRATDAPARPMACPR